MSLRNSQRSSREWLLLAVALILVGAVVIPLWRMTGTEESRTAFLNNWTPQRLGKLLIGPEQAICYLCFTWSSLILLRRYLEVRRQRTAFGYDLLPTDEEDNSTMRGSAVRDMCSTSARVDATLVASCLLRGSAWLTWNPAWSNALHPSEFHWAGS